MSVLEQLDKRAPRAAKLLDNARAHGPIFAETAARYLRHRYPQFPFEERPTDAFLYMLTSKLMLREEAAVGALYRAQQVEDSAEAEHYAQRAEKNAQLALILVAALRKAAAGKDGDDALDIPVFTVHIFENLRTAFDGSEPVARLWASLSIAENRGWANPSAGADLPLVNGANWCPDTANLAEIANNLSVPMAILFFEYLQPPEEKGKRKHGIFMSQDHAQAAYEDGFARPKVPVVRYPNGVTHFEPPLYLFVEQLVENALI